MLEQGGSFAGINRKVQIKPLKWSQPEEGSKEEPRVTEALLILKHGGVLTHAGRQQVLASADVFFPFGSGLLLQPPPPLLPSFQNGPVMIAEDTMLFCTTEAQASIQSDRQTVRKGAVWRTV